MNGILTISIEGDWSGGADTTALDVISFTTDSTHYLKIITNSSNRAGTEFDSTKYRLEASSGIGAGGTLSIRSNYTQVIGLQVRDTTGDGYSSIRARDATGVIIDSCFVYQSGWYGFDTSNATGTVFANCISRGSVREGLAIGSGTNYSYNCTFVGASSTYVGVSVAAGATLVATNCYSGGNGGADYSITGTFTDTTCYSEDGTASTSTAVYSTSTFTNVTAGSEDLSLVSGSDLIGEGTDLSADGTYPFDWDITGATRTTWDVGAAYFSSNYDCVGSGTFTFRGTASPSSGIKYPRLGITFVTRNGIGGTQETGRGFQQYKTFDIVGQDGRANFLPIMDTEWFDKSSSVVTSVYTCVGSGTFTLSGTARTSVVESYIGSGTLAFSGSANTVIEESYIGSGTLAFSGSAYSYIAASYSYTGSGTLAFSGTSVERIDYPYIGSGTLAFSGSAGAFIGTGYNYIGSGAITLSGSANTSIDYPYIGSGSITFSGSGNSSTVLAYNGTGTFSLSGDALAVIDLFYIGSGDFYYSGSANCTYTGEAGFGQIVISETWHTVTSAKVVISETWRDVNEINFVLSDDWKKVTA
jgi:hypothetical protein